MYGCFLWQKVRVTLRELRRDEEGVSDEGKWGGRLDGIEGMDRGTDATHERFLGRIKQLTDRYQMKEMRKEVK